LISIQDSFGRSVTKEKYTIEAKANMRGFNVSEWSLPLPHHHPALVKPISFHFPSLVEH
jgi:hypothetical protein